MYKVSIVVPIYNMESTIEESITSLISQDYKNIEILLIDDGSIDSSLEKCNILAKKDNRIKVYHTINKGAGPARNFGIEKASGKYIYFPDADDYLEKNAITILESTMREKECDLLVFGYRSVYNNKKIYTEKNYLNSMHSGDKIRKNYTNYISTVSKFSIQGAPWNKLFNLEIINKNKVRFPDLRRHQDEAFIANYMNYVDNVYFISDILYTYYTNNLKKEWDKYPVDYIEVVKRLYEERKQNILIWNSEDTNTHSLVKKEFICGVIKSLELSFSPKFNLNIKSRYKWIQKNAKILDTPDVNTHKKLGIYQKFVLSCISKKKYIALYIFLNLKVLADKNGFTELIKQRI